MIVLDASVTLALLLPGEARADEAGAILDLAQVGTVWSPSLWCTEVANGLAMAYRRQRLSLAAVNEARALVSALPVILDVPTTAAVMATVFDTALQYSLTVYDAAYLELALRLSADLASFDDALCRAARSAGLHTL